MPYVRIEITDEGVATACVKFRSSPPTNRT